jgi:hypothetical protein
MQQDSCANAVEVVNMQVDVEVDEQKMLLLFLLIVVATLRKVSTCQNDVSGEVVLTAV